MNIAFFLIPKCEIVYLSPDCTMRQAMERMEYHRYSAVPIIDKEGKYVGTLTEGDLLWKLKNSLKCHMEDTERILLKDIPRRIQNKPVRIDARLEDLLSLAISQNFVPVVDDFDTFIGIIRRREIIEYYANCICKNSVCKLSSLKVNHQDKGKNTRTFQILSKCPCVVTKLPYILIFCSIFYQDHHSIHEKPIYRSLELSSSVSS